MKRAYISKKEVRFLVKALHWAAQDRNALADAWGFEGKEAKQALKEETQCTVLSEILNNYLKNGGQGLYCFRDELKKITKEENYININTLDLKKKIESGEFVVKNGILEKKDEK